MKYTISKQFSFEAAHQLPSHKGKCARFHGHSFSGEIFISSDTLNKNGMVLDYTELKKIITDEIIELFDHTCINDVFTKIGIDREPTAETLAELFFNRIQENLSKTYPHIQVEKTIVHETGSSSAIYSRS